MADGGRGGDESGNGCGGHVASQNFQYWLKILVTHVLCAPIVPVTYDQVAAGGDGRPGYGVEAT